MLGGEIVYEDRRDTGGMFDADLRVEKLPDGTFKAGVSDWHGGIAGPAKATLAEAKADLERLFEKKFGGEA
jgi:hypothetical protein